MDSDLTFITNQPGHNLKERFEVLIKDSEDNKRVEKKIILSLIGE